MLRRSLLAPSWLVFLAAILRASSQQAPPPPTLPDKDTDVKLPNGKSQRDEILKSEHEKSLQDAAEMIRLAEGLKADLEKAGSFVVPVQTIKKTDEIEKLARRIRSRLKRG